MTNSKVTEDIWFNYLYLKLRFIFAYTNYIQSTAITSDHVVSITQINESLRVSDTKRREPQEIFACRGEGHGQLRVTLITPPPTPARLVKLKKEEHRFSIHLFL